MSAPRFTGLLSNDRREPRVTMHLLSPEEIARAGYSHAVREELRRSMHGAARKRWERVVTSLRRENKRLLELQHQLWHALDDAEHQVDGSVISAESYRRLDKLLPKDHP